MSAEETTANRDEKLRKRLLDRMDALLTLGNTASTLLTSAENDESGFTRRYAAGAFVEWRLAAESYLQKIFGPTNTFTLKFSSDVGHWDNEFVQTNLSVGIGVLRAARGEIEFGPLPNHEVLVSGEIFGDLLEMAEHLLQRNCWQAVPSLVGAVLEEGLRQIGKRHGVRVKEESDNLASLNTKLFDRKVYSALVRRQVDAWAAIRNNADHGKFDELTVQNARHMLEGVQQFLTLQLSGPSD